MNTAIKTCIKNITVLYLLTYNKSNLNRHHRVHLIHFSNSEEINKTRGKGKQVVLNTTMQI